MDGCGSERRGVDAGTAVMAVTEWANPFAPTNKNQKNRGHNTNFEN